ncbi:MAG: sepiapterin reductase, partial [Prevotellaceae bacterium]|nr:sepiapterin reductase [Prevotellaceae bacterium]
MDSYVQKPARIKRIHYLINDIEVLKEYEIFAQSDN